jgi:hypothetical protein
MSGVAVVVCLFYHLHTAVRVTARSMLKLNGRVIDAVAAQ